MCKWQVWIITVIVIDQLSKLAAVQWLSLHLPVPVLPFVNLTLVYNDGASFGLLSDAGGWQRWFFIVIGVVVSLYLYRWLKQTVAADTWTATGLMLIISGAVGNVIDRVLRGYVVDFLDVYYQHYHWPVFNVADSAIVIGAMILIIAAARERN